MPCKTDETPISAAICALIKAIVSARKARRHHAVDRAVGSP